jgi:trimethylamine:corrinoid methyltransferase-like protein
MFLWNDYLGGTRAPYLKATSLAAMMDVFFGIREGTWQRKLLQIISSHVPLALGNSFIDAPIDNTQSRWPLIVLSHGLKGFASEL